MAANKFVLKGSGVEVEYTIGITPGLPALIYTAVTSNKTFTSKQVQTNSTGLRELVFVPVVTNLDTGGERFGFFLPAIDVARGQTAEFDTVGVYERFDGPDSVPHRPANWHCIELSGTAQSVIVPE